MIDYTGQRMGNYRLIRQLGRGGFASVYLGQHIHIAAQQAAIKILHLSEVDTRKFQQEAETTAALVHPNIVRLFDFEISGTTPFLIMEYASNGSLRTRYPRGTQIPLATVVEYTKVIASALQYAHNKNIIHRDIKPENILIGAQGELRLTDFGISVLSQTGRTTLHPAYGVGGTPFYMAPEQCRGKPEKASDQYALAIMVYEWLCGSPPFSEGNAINIQFQHTYEPVPSLREKLSTLPEAVEHVILIALAKNPKERFGSIQAFANALEQASRALPPSQRDSNSTVMPKQERNASPSAAAPLLPLANNKPQEPPIVPIVQPLLPVAPLTPQFSPPPRQDRQEIQQAQEVVRSPGNISRYVPPQVIPTRNKRQQSVVAISLVALLVITIVASSFTFVHFISSRNSGQPSHATTPLAVVPPQRGGTWIDDIPNEPSSLIPNGDVQISANMMDQALYAPLFVGDFNGTIQPGIASEIPTVSNGDISSDLKTWTFKLKPNLKWSDGQQLNADDVDFTIKLWNNPQFGAVNTLGYNLVTASDVSSDKRSITFHLKQAFAPFISIWTDGSAAPLPKHHFASIAPDAILKSQDNLHPAVTSGPFMMSEASPGNHYTLVRNPNYYRASEGLPYLDKLVFIPVTDQNTILKNLQAGSITSSWSLDVSKTEVYKQLTHYKLAVNPNSTNFEVMVLNLKNSILGNDLSVRKAMAYAIDRAALIKTARLGQAVPLCTDHGKGLQPGYQPDAPCPVFDPTTANTLLDQDGWVKGSDGIRTKNGRKLEFKYSSTTNNSWRATDELIIQSNFKDVGIKLDIQNYPASTFFGTLLPNGQHDLAEFENSYVYDADDASLLACNQQGQNGANWSFYCSKQMDAYFVQEETTVDAANRQAIFNNIHKLELTDFPFIVLYSPLDIGIASITAHNYAPGPEGATETINVWEWWCGNGQC